MKTVVDLLIIVALGELLYYNLTSIPQQDYIDNNPYVYSYARTK